MDYNTNAQPPRQTANGTLPRQPTPLPDPAKFTLNVAEVLQEFLGQGCSTTERTIQRYCHNNKLAALRVDPDSREVTDKEPYIFLIDPNSVTKRISILKEQQEFSRSTIVTAIRDTSRPAATVSDGDATMSDNVGDQSDHSQLIENEKLKQRVHSLEIDKAVRDKMIEHYKEDRATWHEQAKDFVNSISQQSRQLGALETKLTLAEHNQKELPSPKTPGEHDDDFSISPTVDSPAYSEDDFRV